MDGYVEGLHNLLIQLTSNDTNALKAATATLSKEYYPNPTCIPALTEIIAVSPNEPVRQLAAVELRKRVTTKSGDLWLSVLVDQRTSIKAKLLEVILQEPGAKVRHSTARVISAIAGIELPLNTWPELLPYLENTSTSSNVAHRENGIFIFFTTLESMLDDLQQHLQSFFKLFSALVQDPESMEVRVTTVRALGVLAQYVDAEDKQEIATFQQLLPAMMTVVGQCVEKNDEEKARHLFDVFETLLILEVPLLSKHVPQLAQFLLQVASQQNVESDIRVMALNALSWTVKYKKSKVQSQNLAPAIIQGLMQLATENEPEDIDDDCVSRGALRIIDALATSLPPSQVFPPLSNVILEYMSSQNRDQRRAAMLALGASVEGCSEFMTPAMPRIWPVIEAGLNDHEPTVRKAACTALGCLCEWLEEECSTRHEALIPALIRLIDDEPTQRNAVVALDSMLEILGDAIMAYLEPLMGRLVTLLEAAPIKVKCVTLGAIGSCAHASKANFLPYFAPTMERLKNFLLLTGEGEEIELRGITVDAVGTFADAVGREAFRPYFADLMRQAFAGIEMGSARLRECSFLFFGVMGRVFAEEFAPYLEQVVPALLASCKQEEHGKEPVSLLNGSAAGDETGSSMENAITVTDGTAIIDLGDEELASKLLDVNSAIAVEKEIAADTIEKATLELAPLVDHYYEGIRKSASDSLLEIIRTFYELSNPQEWQAGAIVTVPLHDKVKELIGHILPPILEMFETEDDKGVAAALCTGLAETINKVGPALLEFHLEGICNIAVQILEQKAMCQQDPDQEDGDETPEDAAEYDSVLISSAGDLVAALATALGPDFDAPFNTFYPLIAKYYKKNRSVSDRSSAIGCLAEIIDGMSGGITRYTQPLLDLIYRALSDEEPEVQSNAAFAVGMLVEQSNADLSSQYLNILGALQPFFVVADGSSPQKYNARDNAAGALSRLIAKNTNAVPLDQVMPTLLSVLPLRNDRLENRPVFRAIFHLSRNQPEVIMKYLPQLLPVFAHVLDPEHAGDINDDTRGELIQLVGALNNERPAEIQAAGLGPFVPGQ